MPNTGWHLPGSASTGTPSGGADAWSSHNNIKSNDDNDAFTSFGAANQQSEVLRAYNFGFSADIPSDAQIDGISARFERWRTTSIGSIREFTERLTYGGAWVGSDKAGSALWPTSRATKTLGGSGDLWSWSPSAAQIRASSFGLGIQCDLDGGGSFNSNGFVDYVQVLVYFTEPPAEPSSVSAVVDSPNVDITWTDNADDEDNYEVSVSVNGGAYSVVSAAIAANSESYTDTTGYTHGDTLDYRVRALKSAGPDSAYVYASQITYDVGTEVTGITAELELSTPQADVSAATSIDGVTAELELATYTAGVGFPTDVLGFTAELELTTYRATVYHGSDHWNRLQQDILP